MRVIHRVNLDMYKRGIMPRVDIVQGDTYSRVLEVHLYVNRMPWQVPQDTNICVGYRKPDGTDGVYDTLEDGTIAGTVEGNVVSVILAPQMLSVPGTVIANIMFQDLQLNQIGTFPIAIGVAESLTQCQNSHGYYHYTTLDSINQALSEYDSALEKIIDDWVMDEAGYLYLLGGGNVVVGPIGPFLASGGGGSGGTGADGYSPIAKVTQTENGAVITITDKRGTTTATIANGRNALVCINTFEPRFDVGSIVSRSLADFNRTPEIGEAFVTICANRYYTIFRVVEVMTADYKAQVIHSTEIVSGALIAEEDKEEIVAMTLARLPIYEGEVVEE